MKAAVRLVLAVVVLVAVGLGVGGAAPAAAAGGRIAIASVCHDGDLVPVPGSTYGGVRGTFVITIANTGTGVVKGMVLVGFHFTQKGSMDPIGQGIFLGPGHSTDVDAVLGALGGGLTPDQEFHLTVLVKASATTEFWADRTFSSIAAIPACDASL
jgi:hypothetical protein